MKKILILFAILFIFGMPLTVFAEDEIIEASPIGLEEYKRSCAVCHGIDALGNGVMADSLKTKPSDLTKLSKQNNGYFPHERVYRTIEGIDQLAEHGSREMPVWGNKYRIEAQQKNNNEDLYVRGRLFELMIYLQSIQEK